MTAPVHIGEGGPDDLDAVMAVMDGAFAPAFGEAWTRAQCLGMMTLPGTWLLLAKDEANVIGFALARAVLDEAELLLLAVEPRAQQRGVGRLLVRHALADAARRGATQLHLEVREGNGAATLYLGAGFREVGRRRGYYRGRDGASFDAVSLDRATEGA